ncbi:hypothetical protein IGI66_000590 [Enterococcus sp. AZ048]|uniref:helix-turn-helix domain-containing protein n=1 Tax=Enterococcus sp. AZ048 TaxID=2774658 RepID=UPI003F233DF6
MNKVLVLTKNILAEQEIQRKLQLLNYEVLCSAKVFERCSQQAEPLDFFDFFQYVILSETICESEVMFLVSLLENHPIRIIRKVETKVTAKDHEYLENDRLHAVISNDDSMDELRECLYILKHPPVETDVPCETKKYVQLSNKVSLIRPAALQEEWNVASATDNYQFLEVLHQLSQTEAKILFILIQAGNKVVTREYLCHQVWNEEGNKSHLASLSSTVTRIKGKFEKTSLRNKAIQTLWGKGYRLNPELLDMIQKNDSMQALVSSG